MTAQSSGYAARDRVAPREKKYSQPSCDNPRASESPESSYTCQCTPSESTNFRVGATPLSEPMVTLGNAPGVPRDQFPRYGRAMQLAALGGRRLLRNANSV